MDTMGEFEGLGGIVTGAGSGIGRAVALRLVGAGGSVLAVDLSDDGLESVADEASDLPGRLVAHQADVSEADQVRAYAERAASEFDRLWFFHNNAGVEGAHKEIVDTPIESWRKIMAINVDSFFFGMKFVLPHLRDGGGAVVVSGSLLSAKAAPGRVDYTVSKHAVLGLARTAASEHAKDGIKVNCICPGPIDTPLMDRSEHLTNPGDPTLERKRFESGTPMGRYGTAEEIAEVVAFLLAPRVQYMTGAVVAVDGGLSSV
jgi:NAD(P)-dependent dehydrogenase (short-subunit alcohol dehydrogenase family)